MSRRAGRSAAGPDSILPEALLQALDAGQPPAVLDVRSRAEFARGHVPGAVHIPFWGILWRAGSLPMTRHSHLVVYCGHGPRAQLARLFLRARGFTRVSLLAGHMRGWRRAGHPERAS